VLSASDEGWGQGVTKRFRLSLLTNSALVYASPNAEGSGVAGSQPMSTAVHFFIFLNNF
jgi:hypothetical protein